VFLAELLAFSISNFSAKLLVSCTFLVLDQFKFDAFLHKTRTCLVSEVLNMSTLKSELAYWLLDNFFNLMHFVAQAVDWFLNHSVLLAYGLVFSAEYFFSLAKVITENLLSLAVICEWSLECNTNLLFNNWSLEFDTTLLVSSLLEANFILDNS